MSSETGPISLSSSESQAEDWDRSLREPYPGDSSKETESSAPGPRGDVRTRKLSELLKLHAEKGTDVEMSAEEASAVAEVLGRWINAESSPFEGEDNFFSPTHTQDDSALPSRRSAGGSSFEGRPRGQSESVKSYQS
ncbi:hypothetical protein PHLGIDRAFT_91831 [Phlebiopsis gigantea 11061_1 CR5-6]|uniref:Uncharacterized protein n=1 Tax=Phlebiopsis gigantea (strain 11061_1 CR5-6) TaxID=745531 RepID=A0A0C3NKV4_PHLG1|nr:hypothetical protein PHLGIDRAFT_91831 [Phlebiopsis gigantea 11061_1 CR5-6]